MQLRRTVLALASLALVGGLAACDLPGGTPPVGGFADVEPNDSQSDAQRAFVPQTLNGTLDQGDTDDWYLVDSPATVRSLETSCERGTVRFAVIVGQTTLDSGCNLEWPITATLGAVRPDTEVYLHVFLPQGVEAATYSLGLRFGPAGDTA